MWLNPLTPRVAESGHWPFPAIVWRWTISLLMGDSQGAKGLNGPLERHQPRQSPPSTPKVAEMATDCLKLSSGGGPLHYLGGDHPDARGLDKGQRRAGPDCCLAVSCPTLGTFGRPQRCKHESQGERAADSESRSDSVPSERRPHNVSQSPRQKGGKPRIANE